MSRRWPLVVRLPPSVPLSLGDCPGCHAMQGTEITLQPDRDSVQEQICREVQILLEYRNLCATRVLVGWESYLLLAHELNAAGPVTGVDTPVGRVEVIADPTTRRRLLALAPNVNILAAVAAHWPAEWLK